MRMTFAVNGAMQSRVFDDDEEERLCEAHRAAHRAIELGVIEAEEEAMDFDENEHE